MFEKLKLWLESPVDKNDFFGSNIRELYQTFKLVFGKTPEGPVCERKMTPEEQAAWDEKVRLGVLKMTEGHPAQPKPYDDASFLSWLKIEMNTKIVFLAANKHLFTNADDYIQRYSDIVLVINDAIGITEMTEEEVNDLFKKSALIHEVPKNEEIQKLVNVLKEEHDKKLMAEPVRTIETPVNTLGEISNDTLTLDSIKTSEPWPKAPEKSDVKVTLEDAQKFDERHAMAPACACDNNANSITIPEPTPMPAPSVVTPFLPKVLTDDDHQHIVHDATSDVPAFESAHESYMEHVDPHGRFAANQQVKKDMGTLTAKKVPPTPPPVKTIVLEEGEEIVSDDVPYNESEIHTDCVTARKI